MKSNDTNRQYGERTIDSVQIGLRVPRPLRDKIRAQAGENGRAMTAEFEAILSDGINFDDMIRGPNRDLLLGLFVAGRMAADASQPVMILDSLKKHFTKEALIEAVDDFRARLVAQ